MTEDEKARDQKLKESHANIETAIQEHMSLIGIDGLMTGFVMAASVINITDEGEYDGLWSTQSESLSKWSAIGLATMLLSNTKEYGSMYDDDDDDD